MKISNTTANYINQTYANQNQAAAGQAPKTPKPADEMLTDSINLSGKTQDLQKISKALETESTERQGYVADLKQKVETGQYDVNAEKVAEKIVGQFMDNFG